jgi:hypothetical protein
MMMSQHGVFMAHAVAMLYPARPPLQAALNSIFLELLHPAKTA